MVSATEILNVLQTQILVLIYLYMCNEKSSFADIFFGLCFLLCCFSFVKGFIVP